MIKSKRLAYQGNRYRSLGKKLVSNRVKQNIVLNCKDSKTWGPGAVSLSGKGKALEITISGLLRSDEISGEIQEIMRRCN